MVERGGFEPPVPRGLLWAEIRPEFGALFGPTKSNRAGENLFALGFGFCFGSLRFASFTKVERRCSATSGVRPKLPVHIRGATAPKQMTVTCWRASFPDALSDARLRCGGNDRARRR